MPERQQQGINWGTGQRSFTSVQQPDTQIGVNAPSLQVAQGRPIDFRGLLKLGEDIVENQQKDMTAAIFTNAVNEYQQVMANERATNPEFGDADIHRLNTNFKQNLAMQIGKTGDIKDINAALTAAGKIMESEDQYTIDMQGSYGVMRDANGNVRIFNNPTNQLRTQEAMIADLGPATAARMALLENNDPVAYNQELTRLLNLRVQTEEQQMLNSQTQARYEAAKGDRELQQEIGRDLKIKVKRDIFEFTRKDLAHYADLVRAGELQPQEATAMVSERYAQLWTNSPHTEALIGIKEDPEDLYRLSKPGIDDLIRKVMEGSDPNVPLSREKLALDMEWSILESNVMLDLPPRVQQDIILLRSLQDASTMSLVVEALNPYRAMGLRVASQESVRQFTRVLDRLEDAQSGQAQWLEAANMLDDALINATSQYNIDGAPVVNPEHIQVILDYMLKNPKYEELIPEENKQRHRRLINLMYDNMVKTSGYSKKELKALFGDLIEEDAEEQGWIKRLFGGGN